MSSWNNTLHYSGLRRLHNSSEFMSFFSASWFSSFLLIQPLTINGKLVKGSSRISFFSCFPIWHQSASHWGLASPCSYNRLVRHFLAVVGLRCPGWINGTFDAPLPPSLYSNALAQVNNGTINGDTRNWSHRLEDWRGCDDMPQRWKPSQTCLSPEGIFHPRLSIRSDGGVIASARALADSDECHKVSVFETKFTRGSVWKGGDVWMVS